MNVLRPNWNVDPDNLETATLDPKRVPALPSWFVPHLERRDRPGYVKEGRTNPEVLERGARGQNRANARRQERELGAGWRAAHLASEPHRRRKVLAILEKLKAAR